MNQGLYHRFEKTSVSVFVGRVDVLPFCQNLNREVKLKSRQTNRSTKKHPKDPFKNKVAFQDYEPFHNRSQQEASTCGNFFRWHHRIKCIATAAHKVGTLNLNGNSQATFLVCLRAPCWMVLGD